MTDATRRLRTGDVVRLLRTGSIVMVPERRQPRQPVDLRGELLLSDRVETVRVLDLGGGGACIEVEAPNRLPDTPFRMRLGGELVEASLAWRNCARAGVKFDPQRTEGAADSPVSRGSERKPLSNGAVAGR